MELVEEEELDGEEGEVSADGALVGDAGAALVGEVCGFSGLFALSRQAESKKAVTTTRRAVEVRSDFIGWERG